MRPPGQVFSNEQFILLWALPRRFVRIPHNDGVLALLSTIHFPLSDPFCAHKPGPEPERSATTEVLRDGDTRALSSAFEAVLAFVSSSTWHGELLRRTVFGACV
jgi:hypothetical protein